MRGEAGFTLIEALVAMVLLAVGALSLMGAAETHVQRVGQVTDRVVARWVAENTLTEHRLGLPIPASVEVYGTQWSVITDAQPTTDPDLTDFTIRVGPGDATIVTLRAIVPRKDMP